MTEEELKSCKAVLNELIEQEELEFADNFRFARVGVEDEEFEYSRKAEDGCCGYFDKVVEIKGVEYKVGCNYGH